MFIESSAPRRPNDKARLVSPVYQATATKCLNFWYSMYGADVGHLRVYIQSQNSSAVRIWDLYGDQNSPDWKQGRVAYYSPTPFTVSNEPTTVVIFFFSFSCLLLIFVFYYSFYSKCKNYCILSVKDIMIDSFIF